MSFLLDFYLYSVSLLSSIHCLTIKLESYTVMHNIVISYLATQKNDIVYFSGEIII